MAFAVVAWLAPQWGDDARAQTPPPTEPSAQLSGEEIYRRYTERKARQTQQDLRIISRDAGGSEQMSRFTLRVKDERDDQGRPTRQVRFRTRIDVSDPFDLRHTKYLIVTREPGPNEEFVYVPSTRRVRRADLTRTSFLGTDYTFGDFQVENVEDAVHRRLGDEEIDGVPVYVVESNVKDGIEAEYRKVVAYVEQDHFVPLRTRSWDDHGVEVKEMTAPHAKVRAFDDLWVASESTVRDLLENTTSTLHVDALDTKPSFKRSTFSSGRLARGN